EVSADDLFEDHGDLDETIEAGEERQEQKRVAEQAFDDGAPNGELPAETEAGADAAQPGEGRKRRRRRRRGRGRGHGTGHDEPAMNGDAHELAETDKGDAAEAAEEVEQAEVEADVAEADMPAEMVAYEPAEVEAETETAAE